MKRGKARGWIVVHAPGLYGKVTPGPTPVPRTYEATAVGRAATAALAAA